MQTLTNIQRNIVKEIMRESISKKLKLNENLVAFIVKLLLLDPNWGIIENFMNKRVNIQSFVKYILAQFENIREAKMITLKMQFCYVCNMENAHKDIEKFRQRLRDRLIPLKADICKVNKILDRSDINVLYKKITYYITFLNGLGPPTLDSVYVEALTALKSVMDENELKEFAEKEKTVKEQELDELAKIVCGIRLFNKDCDKGGAGIPNLNHLLEQAVGILRDETGSSLANLMLVVNNLTNFIESCHVLTYDPIEREHKLVCVLPSSIPYERYEQCKDFLILYRQFELFVRKIIELIEMVNNTYEAIYNEVESLLKDIHEATQFKIAVSVQIIFPMFIALSNLWTSLQNQVVILGVYSKILAYLEEYSKTVYPAITMWDLFIPDPSVAPPKLNISTSQERLTCIHENACIYHISDDENIDDINLKYLGFCPWKLVKTEGGLIPGNPSLGICQYHDMNFIFSCPEALREFSANPDIYILHVLNLARNKPQLIHLLDMREDLKQVFGITQLVDVKLIETQQEDKKVQLSKSYDEVVLPYKPKEYTWNVWDLKREAIKLADLCKCRTVSTQTDKTDSNHNTFTQTYKIKTNDVQTKRDNYSNVPKPSTFIYGLRGRKDDTQFIWDITAPPKEG